MNHIYQRLGGKFRVLLCRGQHDGVWSCSSGNRERNISSTLKINVYLRSTQSYCRVLAVCANLYVPLSFMLLLVELRIVIYKAFM